MNKIDLGKHKVAEKWEDITLFQWQEYLRKVGETENNKISIIDTILSFSDISREELMVMPTDVLKIIINKMSFLNEEPDQTPVDKVEIDGVMYHINFMEKLKVQEYLDVNTILDGDKYNYAMMFAVLCRKYEEVYDDEFVSTKLDERIKMFENMPVTKALGLIAFFLILFLQYQKLSQNSLVLEEGKRTAQELVKNIESSLSLMDYITLSKVRQIIKLRKLKKSIECI